MIFFKWYYRVKIDNSIVCWVAIINIQLVKTIRVKSSGHNIRFEGFIFYKPKKNQVHIYFAKTITKISYVEVFNLCLFSHL